MLENVNEICFPKSFQLAIYSASYFVNKFNVDYV